MPNVTEILVNRMIAQTKELARQEVICSQSRERLSQAEARVSVLCQQPQKADVNEMLRAMADNRKIEAIKAHRSLTGSPLKESKDIIEAAMGQRQIAA